MWPLMVLYKVDGNGVEAPGAGVGAGSRSWEEEMQEREKKAMKEEAQEVKRSKEGKRRKGAEGGMKEN